ncbi:hypothetical protein V500_04801 [Pseudogymnoascus sp. VKM F-4518 (FW-2643)]|nr:hypothetical protein V500_04801 [Pseudogymnoascus sp. VKM F-4518 (FW-2643)]
MKYSIVFIGALAALATAQSTSDLSACGQQCVKSMLAQAATLGCTTTDAACLCNKSDFAYGIRDCANEACGSDAPKIIAYGTTFCKDNNGGSGSASSASGSASGSATGTAISSPSSTGGANGGGAVGGGSSASGSSGSGSGAVGGPVPITTSAVVSESKTVGSTTIYSSDASATPVTTIVSDGKPVTTLYGAVGGANGGSGSGSSGSGSESTVTNGSSTFVTTVSSGSGSASTGGSESSNGGAAGGASSTEGSGSGSGTSTSSAGGARQTAAAAGVMAVAGLAAFVL